MGLESHQRPVGSTLDACGEAAMNSRVVVASISCEGPVVVHLSSASSKKLNRQICAGRSDQIVVVLSLGYPELAVTMQVTQRVQLMASSRED